MDQLYSTRRLNQIFVALNLTALALILITIYKDQRFRIAKKSSSRQQKDWKVC
jgi:hypothetical protein